MSSVTCAGTTVKIRDYGSDSDGTRLVEVGWAFVGVSRSRPVRGQARDPGGSLERALRRARAMVRRKVMAAGLDHLLTLTWRENMTDFGRADQCFRRFVRLVQKHIPGWKFVAVPERQERGAWHWHLAVRGWQDVFLLRRLWRAVVGDGNIDVQYSRRGPGWKRSALASYLAKYISKMRDEVGFGRHRYRASQGIVVPEQVRRFLGRVLKPVDVLDMLRAIAGQASYVWTGEEELVGWACTW